LRANKPPVYLRSSRLTKKEKESWKKKRLLPTKQNKKQQNCTGSAFETGIGPLLRKYWAAIEQSDWLI